MYREGIRWRPRIKCHRLYRTGVYLRVSPISRSISTPVVALKETDVYGYGKMQLEDAIFHNVSLTIMPGEAWVIVSKSNATRGELFQAMLGKRRMQPAPKEGVFPFLHSDENCTKKPALQVAHVSFARRNVLLGGEFADYTARYGAMRDQDTQTLLQNLLESLFQEPLPLPPVAFTRERDALVRPETVRDMERNHISRLAARLNLLPQLDIPMVALSNGQQKRARILRQLIRQPRILLLEDPFAGLDVNQRPLLSSLLEQLNSKQDPFVIMELRPQDPVPAWITHVAVIEGKHVKVMERSARSITLTNGEEIASLNEVRVAYGPREVLRSITWSIRKGERWWLKGPNGSGKTTLLSILRGEHPQSYSQRGLKLFGVPRSKVPTVNLGRQVSAFTPEIFSSFPRRFGPSALTVADVIGTGFEGTYAYRRLAPAQVVQRDRIISELAPGETEEAKSLWAKKLFAELPVPEQALAMLMRTLVSKAPLLILDEVFGGMDDLMIKRASNYLRDKLGNDQAAIFVTHWEHEVPWPDAKIYTIDDGIGRILQ